MLSAVERVAARRGWWSGARRWRRCYGRFDPGAAPVVTLLYETSRGSQELVRVEALPGRPARTAGGRVGVAASRAGRLRVARFPQDDALDTLPEVLARPGRARVLRYRPRRRCTIRFDGTERGTLFAKVFPDEQGAAIHREGQAIHAAARRRAIAAAVAEPVDWDPATRSLWQGRVAGEPVLARLAGPEGVGLAERMGRALASLSGAGLAPRSILDGAAQLRRSRRYAATLSAYLPDCAAEVERLLARLERLHAALDDRPLVAIHGSPHVHQWLVHQERLGLVDFDRVSLGHAELDVATFLAEMDFEDRAALPVEAINAAFQAGYEAVHGPLDARLLAVYRAHKRLSKALKAARAVRPDGDRRAARHLRYAREGLGEVGL